MTSSPWAPEKAKEGAELKFDYREQAIDYMGELLRLHMFHRARKVPVAEKEKRKTKIRIRRKKRRNAKLDWKCTTTRCSWMEMMHMFGCMTPHPGTITSLELELSLESSPSVCSHFGPWKCVKVYIISRWQPLASWFSSSSLPSSSTSSLSSCSS